MPKDNIERVLKRAEGGEGEQYEEIRYEGYGAGGTAFIVEALTDNRNRTASEVRAAFSKFGGSLGETGSVSFMFDKVGQIIYPVEVTNADSMFEAALEAGAQDVETDDDTHLVTTAPEDFNAAREKLEEIFGAPEEAQLTWVAQNTLDVNEDQARTLLKFIDTLEDNDDVQSLSFNFEISDEILTKLDG
ncbi:MAG: YebC/PmpR family DNA-binding transcriptional regulator, partial [Candidatus Puniceispirillaceae bacterium]